MGSRGPAGRGDGRRSPDRHTSVIGSTIRDVSGRLQGRGLPRGGIRERDGLKVAEGALPDSTIIGPSQGGMGAVRHALRLVAIVSGSLAALALALSLALAILSHTDVFSIASVEVQDSEHVLADEVCRLVSIGPNETLLNVDVVAIEDKVRKNPWVASVSVVRSFPSTLRIEVHERTLGALVAMSSGGVAWLMGDDGVWIEPTRVESGEGASTKDAALAEAERLGVMLISDVPPTVAPVAGSRATDATIGAVMSFREQLSDMFQEQVASYSAASEDDVSCFLKSGVQVSLGSPTNVEAKESVARRILEEYQGQVTYINVRIPSRPTYRRVNSSFVREGTGATGTSVDETSPYVHDTQGGAQGDASSQAQDEQASAEQASAEEAYGEAAAEGETQDASGYDSGYDTGYDSGYDTGTYDESAYGDGTYDDGTSW